MMKIKDIVNDKLQKMKTKDVINEIKDVKHHLNHC